MNRSAIVAALLCGILAPQAFAAPPTLEEFARHARIHDAKLSPKGDYLAAVSTIEGQRSVSVIRLSDNKVFNVLPRENANVIQLWWVSPTRIMYTIGEAVGGLEAPAPNGELHTVDAESQSNDLLFGYRAGGGTTGTRIKRRDGEYASATMIDPLRGDDSSALIAVQPWNWSMVNVPGGETAFAEARRINLRDGKTRVVATAPLRIATFVADNEGVVRFAYGEDNTLKYKVHYREGDGKPWQVVFDEATDGRRVAPVAFNRAGDTVYFDCSGLCRWSVADRKLETVSTGEASPIEFSRTFDEKDVYAVRSMPGRIAVSLVDKGAKESALLAELMKQFPGEDVRFTSASLDGSKALVEVSSDLNPGTFHLVDTASRKTTPLLARAPWIKPDELATMEPFATKARDGLPLRGYVTKPFGKEEAKNLPLVVFVHGGPYHVRDSWGYDRTVQALASRGYAVLQVNFRGSGGYGYDFVRAGYREWGAKMQDDVTDATKWAVTEGIADPKRICIYGTSYGGYSALQGAVREPSLYRCAIGDAGVYDLALMRSRGDIPQSSYGSGFLDTVLGNDATVLAQRSPINQLDRLEAKVMLIAGGQDKRVPAVQSENLQRALVAKGKKPEWLYQRTEGHGFYGEANVADMYAKIVAFLDANIGSSR
ncbi:alpha/beta hydrolase family protein [Dokdonella sp. MW10]|uniref:alpha/beta hydrolase family protein n=1 Tax=Dokdonella sp. MW10 TaxID=2992926 RepID=UPI003F818566